MRAPPYPETKPERRGLAPRRAQPIAAAARGYGGIVAAQRETRTHPNHRFGRRERFDCGQGPVLSGSQFVALDFLDPRAVLAPLAREMDALAAGLGCA